MNQLSMLARHGFGIGTGLFGAVTGQRIVLPLRRPAVALPVIGLMALVMTVPGISAFNSAAERWGDLEGLFDLTSALFS